MSIASGGVKRARRGGEAEISSALRMSVGPGCWVAPGSCVSDDMVEEGRVKRSVGWLLGW